MATDIVYDAVKACLTENWQTTPLAWENEKFERPEPPAPWVRVELTGTLYELASLGSGSPAAELWREEGILWLHVFVPAHSGGGEARRLARLLTDIFRGLELSPNIEFLDMSIGQGEPGDDDGNWWRVSISIEWKRN